MSKNKQTDDKESWKKGRVQIAPGIWVLAPRTDLIEKLKK